MAQYTVVFQPSGRRGLIDGGKTLLKAAQELGVGIEANCAKTCSIIKNDICTAVKLFPMPLIGV